MTGARIRPTVLATRIIPEVERSFARALGLGEGHRAIALLTCDIDDALFVALDEATKAAEVEVVLARSLYAGSDYPSGPYSGESLGVLGAPDVEQARAGLQAALAYLAEDVWFEQAGEGGPVFFAHVVSRCGTHLAAEAGVGPGTPIAYLIAPPLEATVGVEAAMKHNDVDLARWYPPPSETNFAGGLLTGEQSSVAAAVATFRQILIDITAHPLEEQV